MNLKICLIDCLKIIYENENNKNIFSYLSENLVTMKNNDEII